MRIREAAHKHTVIHCNTLQRTATHCKNMHTPREGEGRARENHAWGECVCARQRVSTHRAVPVCCSVLRCVAVCCGVLQRVVACCSVLLCCAVCCGVLQYDVQSLAWVECVCAGQHAATCCNTLQHTATHCNTPQHTATHRNTLQHMHEATGVVPSDSTYVLQ